MSDIHIHRTHSFGIAAVRQMALKWAQQAEEKYDMECTYEEGELQDTLCFSRPGVKGTLDVGPDALDFRAQLGFLVSAFKERIQAELEQQLDNLLAAPPLSAGPAEAARPASSLTSVDSADHPAAKTQGKSPVTSEIKKKLGASKTSSKANSQPRASEPAALSAGAQGRSPSASPKSRRSDTL